MIIKNIGRKARKINILRRFKKNIKNIYAVFAALLFIVCASGIMLFTPVSFFLSSLFYDSVLRQYNPDVKLLSDFNMTNLVINLSYPMINLMNLSETNEPSGLKTLNYQDELYQEETPASIYKNMPIASDEPIMSIYEHYESVSGAKILEVNIENREIPFGEYKITPINSSGQQTEIPRLLLNNQTSYSVDLNDFIKLNYPINDADISNSNPVVLLVCTHATESYCEEGEYYYSPSFTGPRTSDINKNVILIAAEIKKALENRGIPVIQSLNIHDEISYRQSYARSLETMNAYLEQYPSIKYVIDVHRDSMITHTGEKYKPVININGRNAAQIMMVVGTPEGGAHHPDWTDNLIFAAYMQQKLNDRYPMLARPINLRNARFNQHVTKGSIILEVGSCGNSFDEALYSARLFGECLADLIIENGN